MRGRKQVARVHQAEYSYDRWPGCDDAERDGDGGGLAPCPLQRANSLDVAETHRAHIKQQACRALSQAAVHCRAQGGRRAHVDVAGEREDHLAVRLHEVSMEGRVDGAGDKGSRGPRRPGGIVCAGHRFPSSAVNLTKPVAYRDRLVPEIGCSPWRSNLLTSGGAPIVGMS